jgi:hypothetical protein
MEDPNLDIYDLDDLLGTPAPADPAAPAVEDTTPMWADPATMFKTPPRRARWSSTSSRAR